MCCGSTVASSYGPGGSADRSGGGWVVTYPNGVKETKASEVAARMAASLVPGAKYAKADSSG